MHLFKVINLRSVPLEGSLEWTQDDSKSDPPPDSPPDGPSDQQDPLKIPATGGKGGRSKGDPPVSQTPDHVVTELLALNAGESSDWEYFYPRTGVTDYWKWTYYDSGRKTGEAVGPHRFRVQTEDTFVLLVFHSDNGTNRVRVQATSSGSAEWSDTKG